MLRKEVKEFNEIFDLFNKNNAILTAGGKEFNSMTVSWGQIGVLWNKNIATVYVRPQRYTYEFIEKYDEFTLSFMPLELKEKIRVFGTKSGKEVDKFKESGLTPIYDVDFQVTYLKEAKYVLKLKKLYVSEIKEEGFVDKDLLKNYPSKDFHFVYIGEIKQFLVVGEE